MKKFPEKVLDDIIEKAIQEGKLFSLIFSDEGKRLISRWPEEYVKKRVRKILKGKR